MALTIRQIIEQLATEALPWPGGTYRLHTNERIWDVILVTQMPIGPTYETVNIYSPLKAVTDHTEYSCGYISTSIKYWRTATVWYMSTDGTPVNQRDFMTERKLSTVVKQDIRYTRMDYVKAFNDWAKEHLVRSLYERTLRGCKKDLEAFNEAMTHVIAKGKEQMAKCDAWLAATTLEQDFRQAVGEVMFNPLFPRSYLENTTSY